MAEGAGFSLLGFGTVWEGGDCRRSNGDLLADFLLIFLSIYNDNIFYSRNIISLQGLIKYY